MKHLAILASLVVCLAACDLQKSTPTSPSALESAEGAIAPAATAVFPHNGPDVIKYVTKKYPERLKGGISKATRLENMKFLRDRIIEAGKCGGMDLGWNLKRGGPEVSNDFITERAGGHVIGHDIAADYDNASRPLRLYWGGGKAPHYKPFPQPACQ
jgi:hypothetical protein